MTLAFRNIIYEREIKTLARPLIVLFLIKHLSTLSNELGINEPLKDVSLGIVDSNEKVTLFFWII